MSLSLILAAAVNRVLRTNRHLHDAAGLALCRGARWLSAFSGGSCSTPIIGIAPYLLRAGWASTGTIASIGIDAMILIVIAAGWKQISYNFLFFVAGMQSVPQSLIEAAAIDGAGPIKRFWTIVFPLLAPTTFFLARRQHHLRDVRHLRHHRRHHPGRPGTGRPTPWSTRSIPTASSASTSARPPAQSVVLMLIVIALTAIQFRYVERRSSVLGSGRMVENSPFLSISSPISILIVGVVIVVFPVYLAFIASTHGSGDFMPWPGAAAARPAHDRELQLHVQRRHFDRRRAAAVDHAASTALVMAISIAVGKIIISILSAYAIVFFQLPVPRCWRSGSSSSR